MTKAISLLSGGLDSILATRLMLDQDVDVEAVNFTIVFHHAYISKNKPHLSAKSIADDLGVRLKIFEIGEEFFEVIKNPHHGYGSDMNPCIDCRIFMLKKAAEYMRASGASFLVTGEVLGERPMSQRRDAMRIVEKKSGLEGLILRPLCAKLMDPTIPEEEGLVDREKLLAIKGRSRKPQIQLAKDLGISDYPGPAGGCLLTDSGFANRMRDLIKYKPDFTTNDVQLLKTGRHFRFTSSAKLIVGRNEKENEALLNLSNDNDVRFNPVEAAGPVGIGRGSFSSEQISRAASIVARYSDGIPDQQVEIAYNENNKVTTQPIKEPDLDKLRI